MLPTTIAGKITGASLATVALSTGIALLVQGIAIRKQDVELTKNTMRAAVLAAENTRTSVSRLRTSRGFNEADLIQDARKARSIFVRPVSIAVSR